MSVISPRRAESWRARVLDYVALTKPQIMMLLLITAAGGAFPAASGVPPTGALVGVLAGGVLPSGGASTLNHVLRVGRFFRSGVEVSPSLPDQT